MKVSKIVEALTTHAKDFEFLPTGFHKLDSDLDGGFFKRELVVVGAFTGVGKSYLASQICLNMLPNGYKIAYFSLELSARMILARMIGALSGIKAARVLAGWITPEEKNAKDTAVATILTYEDQLDIFDELYKFDEIKTAAKGQGYDLVIIDFLQNLILPGTEYERLSQASLELQRMAKEENFCVLALSQVSNAANRESGTYLEYKGSGAIAQVADLGFWLEPKDGGLQLILRKNRRGPSKLFFDLSFEEPGGVIREL